MPSAISLTISQSFSDKNIIFEPGETLRICVAASMPLIPGRPTSSNTKFGWSWCAFSIASTPLPAVSMTCNKEFNLINSLMTACHGSKSSTKRIVITDNFLNSDWPSVLEHIDEVRGGLVSTSMTGGSDTVVAPEQTGRCASGTQPSKGLDSSCPVMKFCREIATLVNAVRFYRVSWPRRPFRSIRPTIDWQ